MYYHNYVKIKFKGNEYIGQIKEIKSVWEEIRSYIHGRDLTFKYYIVSIIEKDTDCCISDIEVSSFSEIKPYNPEPSQP